MASDENGKRDSQKTVISSAAPTGVAIGTQIMGTFEITEHIATGGMGEVYRGYNIHTQEPVAIKIVLAALAHDEKILSLFQKEATVLGRLHHDAIVRYMLFTVDPGIQRACLVMEFVEGRSLADYYAEEGAMPAEDVKTMMRRVASGLQKAHDLGVVHRDLSPDNVVIQDGLISHTKIIDFGIAKSANFGGGTLLGGQFAGKYGYVSPEQLGRFKGVIEGTSDIYSLGLVAAAACRGEPIDMGDSPAEAVERRMEVPDLSGVHDELRPLLEMMLQPDPANRPESMAKVLEYLDNPALIPGISGPGIAEPGIAGAAAPGAQASVPPSVPPQYSVPPQGSVPPGQFTNPPGHEATVISTPPQYGFTTPPQSMPPQSMPPQSMPPQGTPPQGDADSPFPAPQQYGGAGATLPPQQATLPPGAQKKGGKGGLIAALVALVVIGGGGAGAYFGGFIPGVGPGGGGGDPAELGSDTGTGTIGTETAGTETTGTETTGTETAGAESSETGTARAETAEGGDGETIDFGENSAPETGGGEDAGTETAGTGTTEETTGGETAGTGATDAGETAETETADAGEGAGTEETAGETGDGAGTAEALAGGEVDPVDSTMDPGEGTEIAAVGPGAGEEPGESTVNDIRRVGERIRWLQDYSTPRCVYSSIVSVTPEEFEIEGYATSVDPFWQLLTDFREAHGTEPKIGVRLVDESQCAVITFVKNMVRGEARPPRLTLDRDVLKSGEPIRGRIEQTDGRDITLFLIDSQGGAYNLTSRLKPQDDGSSTFALALHPQGAAGREIVPYLMLAVASSAPIGSADTQAGTPTVSLMPIIQAEIRQRGAAEESTASASLGYFRFDDAGQ